MSYRFYQLNLNNSNNEVKLCKHIWLDHRFNCHEVYFTYCIVSYLGSLCFICYYFHFRFIFSLDKLLTLHILSLVFVSFFSFAVGSCCHCCATSWHEWQKLLWCETIYFISFFVFSHILSLLKFFLQLHIAMQYF